MVCTHIIISYSDVHVFYNISYQQTLSYNYSYVYFVISYCIFFLFQQFITQGTRAVCGSYFVTILHRTKTTGN